MPDLLLFHSVLGVRQGVADAAEHLGSLGFTVHVPDLYDGHAPFDDYDLAMAFSDEVGMDDLFGRGRKAAEGLGPDAVIAGFSMGGSVAQAVALHRPEAPALLLFHGANDLKWFGVDEWPAGLAVQIHQTVDDPWREQAELDACVAAARASGARVEAYDYDGKGHLFTDPTLPAEYDPAATALLWERVDRFLDEVAPR